MTDEREKKVLLREIDILKEIIVKYIMPKDLLDEVLMLEHARTRYFNVPKSWLSEFEGIIQRELKDDAEEN